MVEKILMFVATTWTFAQAQNFVVTHPTRISTGLTAPNILVQSVLTLDAGAIQTEKLMVAAGGMLVVRGGSVVVSQCEVAHGGRVEFAAPCLWTAERTLLGGIIDLKNAFSVHNLPQFGELLADANGRFGIFEIQNSALPPVSPAWRGEVRFYGADPLVVTQPVALWHLTLDGTDVVFEDLSVGGILHLAGGDLGVKSRLTLNGGIVRQGDEKITVDGENTHLTLGGVNGQHIVTDLPRRGGTALFSPSLGWVDLSRPALPVVATRPLGSFSVARNDHVHLLYPLQIRYFSLASESVLHGHVNILEAAPQEPTQPEQWGRVVGTVTRKFTHDGQVLSFPVGTADLGYFCQLRTSKAGAGASVRLQETSCTPDVMHDGVHYARPALDGAYVLTTDAETELTAYLPASETAVLADCEKGRVGTPGERHAGGLSVFTLAGLTGLKTVGLVEGDVPLGCEIRAFSAERSENKGVSVQWTACREKNLAVYILERAEENERFLEIARRIPANEYEKETPYAHLDPTPGTGAVRYRLKIVDYNGKVSYSPTVEAFIADQPGWSNIYPNPSTDGRFTLRAMIESPGWTYVRYITLTGEIAAQSRHAVKTAGVWQHHQNAHDLNLPAGLYVVEISTPTRKYTHRLHLMFR
jgi:hypothetical protein